MRLQLSATVLGITVLSQALLAQSASRGELAAAIRSAGHPCARVVEVEETGDSSWRVRCNAGVYRVSRDKVGEFAVSPAG